MKSWVFAGIVIVASAGSALAQDLAAGENSFKKCLPCHSVGEDAKNKVGPVLNGLEGRKSGTIEGYNYTEANKNSGIVWDEARRSPNTSPTRAPRFPAPRWCSPASRARTKRRALWAYLKQFYAKGEKK